jgi:hypothetical protein
MNLTWQDSRHALNARMKSSCIWQGVNIFSICCSTGVYLLDFLKVIIRVNNLVASFTDCETSRDLGGHLLFKQQKNDPILLMTIDYVYQCMISYVNIHADDPQYFHLYMELVL